MCCWLLGACNWPHVAWCCSLLPQCGVHAGLGEVDTVSWLRDTSSFVRSGAANNFMRCGPFDFFCAPGPAWSGLCVTGARHHTAILLGLSSLPQTR